MWEDTDQEWAEEAQQPAEEGYKVTARVWGVGQGQYGHQQGEGEGGEGYGLHEEGEWRLQRQCLCVQWSDLVKVNTLKAWLRILTSYLLGHLIMSEY